MNISRLWLTRMTTNHELKDLHATNSLGVLLKGMILDHSLKALDRMNNLGLQMTCAILNR